MGALSKEKGYANEWYENRTGFVYVAKERIRDLRWPHNQEVFGEMIRTSPKVSQVYMAMTQPIERATWRVTPNGAPDEIVQHVADDLRLPVHGKESGVFQRRSGGRLNWSEHLQHALQAVFFGVKFFEQVYEVGADGREHLVKLAPRENTTIKEIVVERDGGISGIVQKGINGEDDIFIPVEHFVAYVFHPRDHTWTGESVLRPMYKHWLAIADLETLDFQIVHRNGMGIPVYEQSEMTDHKERAAEHEAGLEMTRSLQAGEAAGASITPGGKLTLMGVTGNLVSPKESLAYHNNKIAESVGANFLNLDGGGGSYALAGTQADFFFQELQTIADWIAETTNQHVIEDLVKIAYPDYDGPVPLVTCTPIAAKKEVAPGDIAQLVNAGALLKEPNLESWLRQNMEIPEARDLFEALEAKKALKEAEADAGVTLHEPDGDVPQTEAFALADVMKWSRPEELRKVLSEARGMIR